VLPAAIDPMPTPVLVKAREAGIQYDLEEGGDVFFVLTNSGGAKDFRIMTAPVVGSARGELDRNWCRTSPAA
jgi:oligopeptidase B